VAPRSMRRLCRLAAAGEMDQGEALQRQLAPLFEFLAVEANPIPVKWLLASAGRIEDRFRLPLVPLDPCHHATGRQLSETAPES